MSAADRQKWDERYRGQEAPNWACSPFLAEVAELLPANGRAIDVAGGTGRNALWLAERGLTVTLADISPVALEIAGREAASRGLRAVNVSDRRSDYQLELLEIDLEQEPFPAGPWDAAVVMLYLHRPLYAAIARELAPGGLLVVSQPTKINLERNAKPPPAFLLEPGELPGLVPGLEVVQYREGWTSEGRHEAQLVARCRGRTAMTKAPAIEAIVGTLASSAWT